MVGSYLLHLQPRTWRKHSTGKADFSLPHFPGHAKQHCQRRQPGVAIELLLGLVVLVATGARLLVSWSPSSQFDRKHLGHHQEHHGLGTKNHEWGTNGCMRPPSESYNHCHPNSPRDNISVLDIVISAESQSPSIVHVDDKMRFINIFNSIFIKNARLEFSYVDM
jgi:hypothetical protein